MLGFPHTLKRLLDEAVEGQPCPATPPCLCLKIYLGSCTGAQTQSVGQTEVIREMTSVFIPSVSWNLHNTRLKGMGKGMGLLWGCDLPLAIDLKWLHRRGGWETQSWGMLWEAPDGTGETLRWVVAHAKWLPASPWAQANLTAHSVRCDVSTQS